MDKKSKKQIESELLIASSEILGSHNIEAAGKVAKHLKASVKKIAKKFFKAAKATEKKVASKSVKKKAAKKPQRKAAPAARKRKR